MGDLPSAALPRGLAFALIAPPCVALFPTDGSPSERLVEDESLGSFGGRIHSDVLVKFGNLREIATAGLMAGMPIVSTNEMSERR
jgi:hypothetical protein